MCNFESLRCFRKKGKCKHNHFNITSRESPCFYLGAMLRCVDVHVEHESTQVMYEPLNVLLSPHARHLVNVVPQQRDLRVLQVTEHLT